MRYLVLGNSANSKELTPGLFSAPPPSTCCSRDRASPRLESHVAPANHEASGWSFSHFSSLVGHISSSQWSLGPPHFAFLVHRGLGTRHGCENVWLDSCEGAALPKAPRGDVHRCPSVTCLLVPSGSEGHLLGRPAVPSLGPRPYLAPHHAHSYLDIIEQAISEGDTLLIENIGETVDPVLDPLLGRNTIKKGK